MPMLFAALLLAPQTSIVEQPGPGVVELRSEPNPLTVEDIMKLVFWEMERNRVLRDSAIKEYQQRLITRDLKGGNDIKTEVFTVSTQSGVPIRMRISENGKPLKKPEEKESRINFDTALYNRYRFTLAAQSTYVCDGIPCYVVNFEPLPNLSEAKTNEEKVLNHLIGSMVIHGGTWHIAELRGEVREPFKLNKVTTMKKFSVIVKQQYITLPNRDRVLLPSRTLVIINYEHPLGETYQFETTLYGPVTLFQ